ncbi:MAG: S-layer homology domain-containing protein [Acidimicrobiia bacterium]
MRKSTILAVVVAVLMAVPLTLYASHQFQDVPDSHTFHTAIDFMAANGITQGCNPPANTNYCPEDPVTRSQMAGFLKRFHDTFIAGSGTGLGAAVRPQSAPPDPGNGVVDDLTLNLHVPQAGVLVVTGSLQMANFSELDAFSCGINFGSAPSTAKSDSWRDIDLTASFLASCDTITAIEVGPGTQPVRLVISGAAPTTEALQGGMTAVLYTFGGSFGLLGTATDATEARSLSDIPKSAAAG